MAKVEKEVPMKRLVIAASTKGGVGKTSLMVALVDELRKQGVPTAALDADGQVGGLKLACGERDSDGRLVAEQDAMKGVIGCDTRKDDERLLAIDILTQCPDALVVCQDWPGGSLEEMARLATDTVANDTDVQEGIDRFLATLARRGYRLTLVHVLSANIAATNSVKRYLSLFGDRADHIAVRNRFWGRELPFWDGFTDNLGLQKGGKTKADFLAAHGIEIEMPSLPAATAARISAANSSPMKAMNDKQFRPGEQDQAFSFVEDCRKQFKKAGALLGL